MKILGFNFLTLRQIIFLNEFTYGKWTLNKKTGLVDIEGDFNCSDKKLTGFKGVRFGVVTGSFYCYDNNLTSLEGAPQKVGWYFDCSHNSLTSLEGAPQNVGRDFRCYNNKLTSLEGAPQKVGWSFYCPYNRLTSLEGAPQDVGGSFYCYNNSLTSLVGAPQEVGGSFDFYGNPISEKTLKLVWETMRDNKIDYWFALSILKSQIESEDWKKMSIGLDERLSKDALKGISMMDRFGHFD